MKFIIYFLMHFVNFVMIQINIFPNFLLLGTLGVFFDLDFLASSITD